MAQTGYTPILIYSSSTAAQVPAAGNLTNSTLGSELAINITDGKLFYKDNANAVQVIGWKVTPTSAGGTGLTSYTAGDTLYYASGTALSKLAIGGSGYYMSSSGTAPQWSAPAALTKTDDTNVTLTLGGSASTALLNAASLTLGWTGQLAVGRGGTGIASYAVGDLLYASGTTTLSKLAIGTAYQALQVNAGATAPSWQPSATSVLTAQGDLLYASAANTLARLAKNTTATRYLANTGTSNNPTWDQINLANGVTGTLGTTNGGTGLTSFTANGVLYASSTSALATSSFLTWDGTRLKALTNANLTTTIIESASQDAFSRAYFEATGSYQTQTNQCGYRFRWNDGSTTTNLGQIDLINTGAASSTSGSRMRFFTANAGSLTEAARIDESQYLLVGYTSSNGAYLLQVNSQIFATSATIATSDGRYKENVQPLDGALGLVMDLNPVSFNWKQHPTHNFDRSTKTIGFIAQEVQETLKGTEYVNAIVKSNNCVVQEKEIDEMTGAVIKEEKREEFFGIAEGNMVALLTKAIQELKREFDTYKAAHP